MRRGARPQGKVKIEWSPDFAYAIGLLVTDGCLYRDGRHMEFNSKDKGQVINLTTCLGIKNKIGPKQRGSSPEAQAFRVQFGDVLFYDFLLEIGLTPGKSKILSKIKVPDEFIFDFLRGHFDGDGTFYSYWDPRWKSSFMFYTGFMSASLEHVEWLQHTIHGKLGIKGHITKPVNDSVYQLKYAKADSLKLLAKLYYNTAVVCLPRKRLKIEKALNVANLTT